MKRISMYLICKRAWRRPQSHHTHRETHRALQPRQPRFTLPISTLGPAFLTTCRLLAGTDRPAQPAHAQQPHTARAPAGAARRPGAGPFSHSITAPLHFCTLAVAPGTPPARPCPQNVLRSPSTAGQPCISTREARRKSAIRRRSPPPTSSTCSTATKSSSGDVKLTAACAGMLGTVPHHSQPPCCPYRGRNRKPFRAGGRGRPAGVGSGENAAERT